MNIDKELEKLNDLSERKGVSSAVSNLKESIIGKKKRTDNWSAIIDPKTNKLKFKPSESPLHPVLGNEIFS